MSSSLNNMCRTCMLKCAKKSVDGYEIEMVPIFIVEDETKEVKLSLKQIIKTTVPQLNIEENDYLPKNVCKKCSEKIIGFYKFQQKALQAEKHYYKLFNEEIKVDSKISCSIQNSCNESTYNKLTGKEYRTEDNSNNSDDLICNTNKEIICKPRIENNKSTKRSTRNLKKKKILSSSKHAAKSKNSNTKELYSCDRCQRKLKSKLSLMNHLDMHIKKERAEKEMKCDTCSQVFQELSLYKDHQRTHISERTFLCSECGKAFTSAGSLKQHSFRHLDKKLYRCSDCPKSFPTNGDLRCHYEIHKAKPRIHVCEVCGRGFYKPFLLKQHQRYHNDERPFACEFCEKRFITSEKQRRHMRTHTGEKPYCCKYCERAFAQSNDCIKHLRQHLGDNVYQCELCPLRFPLARDLRIHFATHKDDDDDTRSRNLSARIEEERNLKIRLTCQGL